MRRRVHVPALVLLVLAIWTPSARADVWDWLDELSGPGPWHSRGNLTATLKCLGTKTPFMQEAFDPAKRTCFFIDVRRFKNKDDLKYFDTRMEIYETGPMIRVLPSIEVGAGVGVMHLDSSGGTGRKFNKMTFSFPRVVFKPLLIGKSMHPDLGFFQLYFRENRIVGELKASDFNPKPGTTWSSDGDLVKSYGFMIDLPLAIHGLRELLK